MNAFGAELDRQRQARGMTQQKLAEQVRCSHSAISRLIGGQRNPSPEMVTNLVYGLYGRWFFAEGETVEEREQKRRLYLAAGFVPPKHKVIGLVWAG